MGSLKRYNEKRNFDDTPEPSGKRSTSKRNRFVVQKHDASSLHYDFRLEVDGVLKSWAVPKGPSTDPAERRLAMPTEDHPLNYIDFEGVIPAGNYGAGPVIVWDRGDYENLSELDGDPVSLSRALREGRAKFRLQGSKVKGAYSLRRVELGRDKGEKWLLVKIKDEDADPSVELVTARPESVLSGRTVEEVFEQEG